jgi:hypothetical protein
MAVTNVTPPTISGQARQGSTLFTTDGTWTYDLAYLSYAYQWLRCDAAGANCNDIAGATNASYLLTAADVGSRIRSEVTATESAASSRTMLRPWNEDCFWYTPLPVNPDLNASSAAMIARLNFDNGHPKNASVQNHYYGSTIFETSDGDPTYTFTCSFEPSCNINAEGQVPVPAGASPDPSDDGHMVIVDLDEELSWEFWIYQSPGNCLNGHVFDMNGSGGGETPGGAVAGRTPMLPALLRPEEIVNGVIPHMLCGSLYHLDSTRSARIGQVWPCVANDGASSNVLDIYEGTVLQIDPSVNVAALAIQPWEKVIAVAMQDYGWCAVDKGGAWAVKAETGRDSAWAAVGMGSQFPGFSAAFPWSSLRVLAPPNSQSYPYWT